MTEYHENYKGYFGFDYHIFCIFIVLFWKKKKRYAPSFQFGKKFNSSQNGCIKSSAVSQVVDIMQWKKSEKLQKYIPHLIIICFTYQICYSKITYVPYFKIVIKIRTL